MVAAMPEYLWLVVCGALGEDEQRTRQPGHASAVPGGVLTHCLLVLCFLAAAFGVSIYDFA
jgi:hypothetical protein